LKFGGKIKTMKEALLYQNLENEKVKCLNCPHYCIIENKKRGICGVRDWFSEKCLKGLLIIRLIFVQKRAENGL